ncbi:MAG TPA: M1 family metallopeptidase [Panacibacter sp.]|nr:M1 family metallopeptidase [Panacibacter sp.]
MFFIFFVVCRSMAQQTLPVPRNIEDAYINNTRSTDGKPGKNYWQNKASYLIDVSFYPATRQINGTVTIDYINNSPDTLTKVLFKLYPNLYKKGSPRVAPVEAEDVNDGVHINSMAINGKAIEVSLLDIAATNMEVDTEEPLAPKTTARFIINYSYSLNKGSHIRTGEVEPGAAFIAYFFPRIAVYDDIDGWNKNPYTGLQEFYNDFCSFKVNITVPENYIVWATGNLSNCSEVFNDPFCKRMEQAIQSDTVINIIDSTDLQKGNITANNPMNTWRFEADAVTDFAFAISNHYIWKAAGLVVDSATGRRTRVDAVFNPAQRDYYEVINFALATIKAMSFIFPAWPYPYSHETVFQGLDQMEYPMMVNDNPLENRDAAIELTDHEIFHTMFPFYMGINETKYAWMDEGWATIGEWLISSIIDSNLVDYYGIKSYENTAGNEDDLPVTTLTTLLSDDVDFLNSYPKPAFGYLFVKDMLGDAVFTKALHYYIAQWHGKHPMPYDFFNCMNAGSGKNLNWFWKRWFFDNGVPDLAISKVIKKKNAFTVIITSVGTKPVPVDLTAYYTDGSTQKLHRSIAVWESNNPTVALTFTSDKSLQKLILGSTYIPDINHNDNIYEIK